MNSISVRLSGPSYNFELRLYTHYTIIEGIDSGEGKSWLFETLQQDYVEGLTSVECNYPVVFGDVATIEDSLNRTEVSVIFVDEIMVSKDNQLRRNLDLSKHLIVAITRDSYFNSAASLNSIYQVCVVNDNFIIRPYNYDNKLPLCNSLMNTDIIVTEASVDRSEYALIDTLCKKYNRKVEIVPAGGKDKIHTKLAWLTKTCPDDKIVVFTDLGNIISQLRLLTKRCKQNPNISFYDWESFEELFCNCMFILGNAKFPAISQFNYFSLEKYFEKVLEWMTKGTPYEYTHKKPKLSSCYFEECFNCKNCDVECDNKLSAVLDNKIGKVLFEYYSKDRKSEGLPMMDIDW